MRSAFATILLPPTISSFERRYLRQMNRIAMVFFILHLPVFVAVAYFNDTGPGLAAALTLGALVVPCVAYLTSSPRGVSISYGFVAMLMGALLVHFGQGRMQIEMHFYFFALLAMLALFGNPMVIVVAAATLAIHLLLAWIWVPRSVFNYDAPVWVVAVHAIFVVLESTGSTFIARSFFDHVIGLEKIVQTRTDELDARNRSLRLVLDNVGQGFLTVGRDGSMSEERSAIVSSWLGQPRPGDDFASYLRRSCPEAADRFEFAWAQVVDGVLPLELSLDQLPPRARVGALELELEYSPIVDDRGALTEVLVVISDVTAELERKRLEAEQREVMVMFGRVMDDRVGFLEFVQEAGAQIEAIVSDTVESPAILKRVIHTLKGNAGVYQVGSIAALCYDLEEQLVDERLRPTSAQRAELERRWTSIRERLRALLGERVRRKIEIEDEEYEAILRAVLGGRPRREIAEMIASWRLEPVKRRLDRIAAQARRIAHQLRKDDVEIRTHDDGLRLDPDRWASFWSAFVHVVHNALDHGIEPAAERRALGKPERGALVVSTAVQRDSFVIEVRDDGRGIDWRAVADSARERGLPASTDGELVEALFCDGLTTKQTADDVSGRGIGMGAAREACRERNGSIRVDSSRGKGTRIEFRFPRSEMVGERAIALSA